MALSAFDSFCRGVEQGRFPQLKDRDGLWALLVLITVRKAADLANYNRRERRGSGQVRGDSALAAAAASPGRAASRRSRPATQRPTWRRSWRRSSRACSTASATTSCARSRCGGWKAIPTPKSPDGSAVPRSASGAGSGSFAKFSRAADRSPAALWIITSADHAAVCRLSHGDRPVSEAPSFVDDRLSEAALRRVDDVCARFEDAWRKGQRPRLETFLAGAKGPERAELLRELLRLEIHYRQGRGERVAADDYEGRFPNDDRLDPGRLRGRIDRRGGAPCGRTRPPAPCPTTGTDDPDRHQAAGGAGNRPRAPQRRSRGCRRSPATKSWSCWAAAAWGWCTRRGRRP